MTKILNLDKLETRREKAIILNGKEHVMKTLTVKEYIYHMREADKLSKMDESAIDTLDKGIEATINILANAFPTVERSELEALSLEKLEAIRGLVDDATDEDAQDNAAGEANGESKGE